MLAIVLISVITVTKTLPSSGEESYTDLIARSISALDKTAAYFQRQYSELNVDGLTGLRVAEGHVQSVLSAHSQELEAQGHLESLRKLHQILQNTGELAIRKNDIDGDEYYKKFKRVLAEAWYYQAPVQKYQDGLVAPVVWNDDYFEEGTSDECMSQLLGSQEVGPKKACEVTDKCWTLMTGKGTGGYFLTHQILYFVLAEKFGCRDVIRKNKKVDFHKLYPYFGSNVYSQMQKNPRSSSYHKDLFLEQGIMCDWVGIDKCVQIEWIEEILPWQDQSGCILNDEGAKVAKKVKGPSRRLNVEVVLDDGCSTHMTSLFLAYLAASLHWLVRNNTPLIPPFTSTLEQYIYVKVAVIVVLMIWLVLVIKWQRTRISRLLGIFIRYLNYFYRKIGNQELV